jgi:hypothetical protein
MEDIHPMAQPSPESSSNSGSDSSSSEVIRFEITNPNPPSTHQSTMSPEYDRSKIDPESSTDGSSSGNDDDNNNKNNSIVELEDNVESEEEKKEAKRVEEEELLSFDHRDDPSSSDEDEVLVKEGEDFVLTNNKKEGEEENDGLQEPVEEVEEDEIYHAMVNRSTANLNLPKRKEILMAFVSHPSWSLSSYFHNSMAKDPQLLECDRFLRNLRGKSPLNQGKVSKNFNNIIVAKKLRILSKFLVASDSLWALDNRGKRRAYTEPSAIQNLRSYYEQIVTYLECKKAKQTSSKSAKKAKKKDGMVQLDIKTNIPDWNQKLKRCGLQCPECEHNLLVEYPPREEIDRYTRQTRRAYEQSLNNKNNKNTANFGLEKESMLVCMCCVNTCWDVTNGSGCVLCVDYAKLNGSAPYTKLGGCSCSVCRCTCSLSIEKRKLTAFANEKQLKKLEQQLNQKPAAGKQKSKKREYDMSNNRK